jgi:hypothetical protein
MDLRMNNKDVFTTFSRALSLTKDIKWIRRNIDKINYAAKNESNDQDENYLEFLARLFECLDFWFAGNWDMTMTRAGGNYYLDPIIRFKNIEITNSKNESKKIGDLIVQLTIMYSSSSFYISGIQGTRTDFTYVDIVSRYVHSHLRSFDESDILKTKDFCLGSGEIVEAMYDMSDNNSRESLDSFMLILKTFVAWESLEGVPFRKMADTLDAFGRNLVGETLDINLLVTYLKQISTEHSAVDYFINDGRILINNNKAFNDLLRKSVVNKSFDIQKRYLCKRLGESYYSTRKDFDSDEAQDVIDDVNRRQSGLYTYIQGEKIHFKVRNAKGTFEKDNINEFNLHPKTVENVKRTMERKLWKDLSIDSEVDLQHQITRTRQLIEQNQISV